MRLSQKRIPRPGAPHRPGGMRLASRRRAPRLFAAFIFFLFAFLVSDSSAGEPRSSTMLIELSKDLDGTEVRYRGEVVGAILKRGDYVWLNLNDGENAMGVWCEAGSLPDIKFVGGYDWIGDTLEVRGTFYRACGKHDGEMDIHASSVVKIGEGRQAERPLDRKVIYCSIVVFAATLLLVLIFRRRV